MNVVYLDQNQWVRLARAWKAPSDHRADWELGIEIGRAIDSGRLCLPLMDVNLYETYKINRSDRRLDLALIQCRFSRGSVFAHRRKRLDTELSWTIKCILDWPAEPIDKRSFLSNIFLDAFPSSLEPGAKLQRPEVVLALVREKPDAALFDYLTSAPDVERKSAVHKWTMGADQLRGRIETRRLQWQGESLAVRKRAYRAMLMLEEIDVILTAARNMQVPWRNVGDIGSSNARRLMRDVPAFDIECELAVRLEDLCRPIEENDLRDMQTFCTVVPYTNCVISENIFVNLALQARLDKKYRTTITTDLLKIRDFL